MSLNLKLHRERTVPLEGVLNMRDIGGLPTDEGRWIRTNLLYRSAALNKTTRLDREEISRRKIKKIIDFRDNKEIRKQDRLPKETAYKHYPIEVAGIDLKREFLQVIRGKASGNPEDFLVKVGQILVKKYSVTYSKWLNDIIDHPHKNLPQIYHCAAGKDRTGFGTALIYKLLGVGDDLIMEDYLLSNLFLDSFIEHNMFKAKLLSLFYRFDPEMIRPLTEVRPSYLKEAFKTIYKDYGSFKEYASKILLIDEYKQGRLKEIFLE
ncbi:tyrosine-protein phosphatase [Spirochaeta cellobiosiphila]|uniref:tyrosine-protein phosphatase n=1 Tax=Spirochaeta cellobiosiphila TaxID=504483 RepID=UPI00069EFDB2|nr:tyrosine-protein phosphatase [Spirochaeta cellobiosiphila]